MKALRTCSWKAALKVRVKEKETREVRVGAISPAFYSRISRVKTHTD